MKGVIKKISSDPLGLIGLCLVTLMVISALGAPIFAPYDPIQLNIMERLQGPLKTFHDIKLNWIIRSKYWRT